MTASRAAQTQRVLARLAQQKARLEVNTLDMCFMALLCQQSAGEGVVAFGEQQLLDAYERISKLIEPESENIKARATHAIRRLREQQLLARVDGAGVLRAGEFMLTRLATGIVDFFVGDTTLTPENLALLMETLRLSLAEIVDRATLADGPESWHGSVVAPLEVTVSDLIAGIEARQRGLDLEQEEFQRRIAGLLSADWFGAIEQCQDLLETSLGTLRELNDILLKGTHELTELLERLLALAAQSQYPAAEASAERLIDQVQRIGNWGNARQQAWTEYYEYVHRYLRDVVRFDPSRALTQRLRKMLSEGQAQSFYLTVAAAPGLKLLREVKPPDAPPPVRRRQKLERDDPEPQAPRPNPDELLEQKLQQLLDSGESDLSELVRRLTVELPENERFLATGRIAKLIAKLRRPLSTRERPWVAVAENLAIEQWHLHESKKR